MAIVSPNSLAEAEFASLVLDRDRTLYISPIQSRNKRCKVWKQVYHVREIGLLVGVQRI